MTNLPGTTAIKPAMAGSATDKVATDAAEGSRTPAPGVVALDQSQTGIIIVQIAERQSVRAWQPGNA